MNKRLVAVGVAVVLIVLVLILNVVFKHKSSSGDICQDFIVNIQKGKDSNTYDMLSSQAQAGVSTDSWKQQVRSLKIAYYNGTLTKRSADNTTQPGASTQQTREVFEIKSGSSRYQATCFMSNSKLDAFDSQPIY